MTPEDLAAAGLSQTAMATDDELAELLDEIEAILLQAQGTPGAPRRSSHAPAWTGSCTGTGLAPAPV